MKATEQYFPVVTFESVDEILKCVHSDKSSSLSNAFLSYCPY